LEISFARQSLVSKMDRSQKRRYRARVNNSFLKTASVSGRDSVGDYSPNGDHCEKPLEMALKSNVAILSLFEMSDDAEKQEMIGTEIENMAVLLTDQGLLMFNLYSHRQPYDTSLAWCCLFKSLVQSIYVPRVIIPHDFPDQRIFSHLRKTIETEHSTSLITFREDCSFDLGNYYDFKPEMIKEGDIVISLENVHLLTLPTENFDRELLFGDLYDSFVKSSTGLKKHSVPKNLRNHW